MFDWRSSISPSIDRAESAVDRIAETRSTLIETRTSPGPATLRHHNAMLGVLRTAGFSLSMTAHAYALIDAYVYGFVLQEVSLPFDSPDTATAVTDTIMEGFAVDEYPYLVESPPNMCSGPDTTSALNSNSGSTRSSTRSRKRSLPEDAATIRPHRGADHR